MTYRLVLLRHAKAEREGTSDLARALAPKGRKQATGLSKSLADAGVKPEVALISSAVRTQQTWQYLAGGKPKVKCHYDILDSLYAASVADVLQTLRVVSSSLQTAVIVGHEPTMSACAAYLAGSGSDEASVAQVRVGLPTAAWALLQSDYPWAEWGRGSATLVTVRRPA